MQRTTEKYDAERGRRLSVPLPDPQETGLWASAKRR